MLFGTFIPTVLVLSELLFLILIIVLSIFVIKLNFIFLIIIIILSYFYSKLVKNKISIVSEKVMESRKILEEI